MGQSLFERLGGNEGITKLAGDVVDNHLTNNPIATRYCQ
jgi:hemoglobin